MWLRFRASPNWTREKISDADRKGRNIGMAQVRFWRQLPAKAQEELSNAGFTQEWFDAQPEPTRLTLLDLYVKMSLLKLWRHVKSGQIPRQGDFEFRAVSVAELKRELTERHDFGTPETSVDSWNSGEKAEEAMLHFKHEKDWGQDPVTIQAHIDPVGWSGGNPISWARHLKNHDAYMDPYRIRDVILRKFGSQREVMDVLFDVGASSDVRWNCGASNCPTHSMPEHRCLPGVWFCGCKQPPCPSHRAPEHRCTSGQVWHCGAQDCVTHSLPDHHCADGVWHCGRLNPPCPGHMSRDDRCQAGAALLWPGR
jgi:hypothetical protein